jgi:hypothetical protein
MKKTPYFLRLFAPMVAPNSITIIGLKEGSMLSNNRKKQIIDIVLQHKGTIIDYQNDGLVVLDKTGKRVHRINNNFDNNEHDFLQCKSELVYFLNKNEKLTATLYLFYHDICDSFFREDLIDFIIAISKRRLLQISIFFQESPVSWMNSLSPFISSFSQEISNKQITVSLVGTFNFTSYEDKNFLFENNFHLFHVCNPLSNDKESTIVTLEDYSNFGFKIPFVWYYNESYNNIINLCQISEYLSANMFLGFAFPLEAHSPYCSVLKTIDSKKYINFLLTVYKKYPYFENVFYPLAAIAANSHHGLYTEHGLRRSVNLLYTIDKGLQCFGHVPALAIPCETYTEKDDAAKCVIVPKSADSCLSCPVQSMCGTEFSQIPEHLSMLCEHQYFFIKFFLWERLLLLQKCNNRDNFQDVVS